jgi:uncharacterized protein YjiS (DUF1127 family)
MTQLTHNHSPLHTIKENLLVDYKKIINSIILILQKRKTRKELAELSDHLLKDLGLSSDEVQREINNSFWTLK